MRNESIQNSWQIKGVDAEKSKDKALYISSLAFEKKADDIIILDMQKVSTFCDYFVITSAGSFKKTRAIADHIEESLEKEKIKPHHIEGRAEAKWILLDYGDVVANVFYEETRCFYALERLWGDAKRIDLNS